MDALAKSLEPPGLAAGRHFVHFVDPVRPGHLVTDNVPIPDAHLAGFKGHAQPFLAGSQRRLGIPQGLAMGIGRAPCRRG